jgi:hypothetical protein
LECGAVVLYELLERTRLPVQDSLYFGARLVTGNLGIGQGDCERFDHPCGQPEALQLSYEVIDRHVQVFDRPTKHTGKHSRLRVAVEQLRAIEVIGLFGMSLLGQRGDRRGCDVPRVNERDTLGGRAVGEGVLFYLLGVAEEVLHKVICSQDDIGNAAVLDPPLTVAIPLGEANGVVIGDFPGQFHDPLHADTFGFSEKILLVAPLVRRTRGYEK